MRTALSNILGEFVEAHEIEHADTAGFQIVCPCCREGVFKVERSGHGRRAGAEFFSHRRATDETKACEERVGSLSRQWIAKTNATARGQTLGSFLSVLKDAISLDRRFYGNDKMDRIRAGVAENIGAGLLLDFSRMMITSPTRKDMPGLISRRVDGCFAYMERYGHELDTSFSRNVQKRITTDMYLHLLTPQARPTLDFAIRHAMTHHLVTVVAQSGRSSPSPGDDELLAAYGIMGQPTLALCQERFEKVFFVGGATPALVGKTPASVISKFITAIECEIINVLLKLPYQAMAANAIKGVPILDGVEPSPAPGVRPMAGVQLTEAMPLKTVVRPVGHLLSLHVQSPGSGMR